MGANRKKCVIKALQYDEFMERVKKSFYYGHGYEDNLELTSPLAEYASEIFSEPQKGNSLQRLTKFSAGNVRVPNPCSLIVALIYLDRLNESNPGYVRNCITPSDLFLVSVIISSKFYFDVDEDSIFYLDDFLQDCDMTLECYKNLEKDFLKAIDWNVNVTHEEFEQKLLTIEKFLAKREGIRRGWLTYTELMHYLPSFTLAKFFLNNITVMAVSYVASVMTMAGAFFLVSNIPGNGLLRSNRNQFHTQSNSDIPDQTLNSTMSMKSDKTEVEESISDDNNDLMAVNNSVTDLERIRANDQRFNIEKELQKLEDQYRNEEELTKIKSRNNEYPGPLLNFNTKYLIKGKIFSIFYGIHAITKWTSFDNALIDDDDSNLPDFRTKIDKNYNENDSVLAVTEGVQNYTNNIFWELFYDAEKSLKVPFMWFKFI